MVADVCGSFPMLRDQHLYWQELALEQRIGLDFRLLVK